MRLPWYRAAFGLSYLTVYRKRDEEDAQKLGTLLSAIGYSCRGKQVLDIGCGHGRHLRVLEEAGARACGIDLSRVLLAEARRLRAGESVVLADMRALPFGDQTFDLTLSLFTTFGYFDTDEENERVLREARRVLKGDGRLVLDYLNPVRLRKRLVPESRSRIGSVEVVETRWVDARAGRVNKRVEVRDRAASLEPEEAWVESLRLWSVDELMALVGRAGFGIDRLMGTFDGAAFSPEISDRMILLSMVQE